MAYALLVMVRLTVDTLIAMISVAAIKAVFMLIRGNISSVLGIAAIDTILAAVRVGIGMG